MSLYVGLMSGTSMDGIDAALVQTKTNTLLCGLMKQYSDALKKCLDAVIRGNNLSLANLCQLNTLIGREFAGAVLDLLKKAKRSPEEVRAIGSHGQTLCHDPKADIPYTLQLGCGHTIASLTGIPVVADFRTRDLVNGGQGAPFAPLYHQQLFYSSDADVAVLNLGGIANISFISSKQGTTGWDVGPGNCLMDAWIKEHQGKPFDKNGFWASQGLVLPCLLEKLLLDPLCTLAPPKSMGKEYFSMHWLQTFLKEEYKPVDVQATLLAFTAHLVAISLSSKQNIKNLYLCGGGTHNGVLHQKLSDLLPNMAVRSVADLGINPDYVEAMMFAWLAEQTLHQKPLNLTQITGAKSPAVLGVIYPLDKPNRSRI